MEGRDERGGVVLLTQGVGQRGEPFWIVGDTTHSGVAFSNYSEARAEFDRRCAARSSGGAA